MHNVISVGRLMDFNERVTYRKSLVLNMYFTDTYSR